MLKAMYGQGWDGGALWGSVLSSLVRFASILALLGFVRSCPARLCAARQAFSLRGLVLYGTVLSCPVRLCKAVFGEAFRGVVSYGGAGSCPAGSSGVWLGKVRCFLARHGMVLHCKVQSCLVEHGTVVSWLGEVLFGVVGFIGALYGMVCSYCGVVWSREALHSMVKFCPVKYSMVLRAKALFWLSGVLHGFAWRGSVGRCLVRLRKVIFWHGTVGSGFARLRAVGQALVSLWPGGVMLGGPLFGGAMHGDVWLGHGHVRYET